MFVGYPYGQKGWHLFDLELQEFSVSRDVVFHESEFLYASVVSVDGEQNSDPMLWALSNDVLGLIDILGPSNVDIRPNNEQGPKAILKLLFQKIRFLSLLCHIKKTQVVMNQTSTTTSNLILRMMSRLRLHHHHWWCLQHHCNML